DLAQERREQRGQPEHGEGQAGSAVRAGELLDPDGEHQEERAVGDIGEDPGRRQATETGVLKRGRTALATGELGGHRVLRSVVPRASGESGSWAPVGAAGSGSGLTVPKSLTWRAPSGRSEGSSDRPAKRSARPRRSSDSWTTSSAVAQKEALVTVAAFAQAADSRSSWPR